MVVSKLPSIYIFQPFNMSYSDLYQIFKYSIAHNRRDVSPNVHYTTGIVPVVNIFFIHCLTDSALALLLLNF